MLAAGDCGVRHDFESVSPIVQPVTYEITLQLHCIYKPQLKQLNKTKGVAVAMLIKTSSCWQHQMKNKAIIFPLTALLAGDQGCSNA